MARLAETTLPRWALALLSFCALQQARAAVSDVRVIGATNVQAVISYEAFDESACSVEISEDPSLRPLVHDVNPDLFPGANTDAREAGLSDGRSRVFVAGKRAVDRATDGRWYSRALQTDTTHYFRIQCGPDSATGSFRTANLPVGATYPWPIPQDPATGDSRWPTVDSDDRSQKIIDPNYGTLIRRVTVPGDAASQSWTGKTFANASGTSWENPAGALRDDGNAANFSGQANGWLALTDPDISFSSGYLLATALDFVTVRIKGSAQGSVSDQRTIHVCLTVEGANCRGEIRSAVLDNELSVKTLGAAVPIDTWGEDLWLADLKGNKSFGVLIRAAGPSPGISIQSIEIDVATSEVAGMPTAGSFQTCSQVKSNGGYHCSLPGAGGSGANYMFWIHPETGESRWLGKIIATNWGGGDVQCLSSNALWDATDPNIYYCGADVDGRMLLLKGTYTGNDAPAARSAIAQMTWENMTPASVENLARAFNPDFDPAAYRCSLYAIVNRYATFTCQRGIQGSFGWLVVLDVGDRQPIGQGGAGRVVAAAKAFASPSTRWCGIHALEILGAINWIGWSPSMQGGNHVVTLQTLLPASEGRFNLQVSGEPSPFLMELLEGDVLQMGGSPGVDLIRILRKSSSTEWFVERKVVGAPPTIKQTGAQMNPVCSAYYRDPYTPPSVYWSFLQDPSGRDPSNRTWVVEQVLNGSHNAQRGNYRLQAGLNGYEVVTPGPPASWNQPVTFRIESNPKWAGVRAWVGLEAAGMDSFNSHPSYENYRATDPGRNNWFVDAFTFAGSSRLTSSVALVRGFLQVYRANGTRLNRGVFPAFAACGGRMLKEINTGPIRDQDAYTFCVGKDCVPGAGDSDVFINCPSPVNTTSLCNRVFSGDASQVCVADLPPYGQSISQFFFDRSGLRNRVLTNGMMRLASARRFTVLDTASPLPDGSWVIFPTYANKARRDVFIVKVPSQPSFDNSPDALSQPMTVTIPVAPPADSGAAEVVVRYGATGALGSSTAPQACASGGSCNVTLQVRPGEVVFATPQYRDAGGRALGDGPTQVRVGGGSASLPADRPGPRIYSAGVVNAASSQPEIAPGGIVAIHGENLASCEARAQSFPLPSTLCEARVTFSGRPGFFYYASPSQLNVLIPSSVTPQQDLQVTVTRQGGPSDNLQVPASAVGEVAPAIFPYMLDDQLPRAVVQNSDASISGPIRAGFNSRPLRLGEAATLYANSLGSTTPSVPDGQAAPPDPPARTVRAVELYVNAVRQRVLFSGLTPGLSGLYQVNFVLDAATPVRADGESFVRLVVNGVESPRLSISIAQP